MLTGTLIEVGVLEVWGKVDETEPFVILTVMPLLKLLPPMVRLVAFPTTTPAGLTSLMIVLAPPVWLGLLEAPPPPQAANDDNHPARQALLSKPMAGA
jgi:hypothetical protein